MERLLLAVARVDADADAELRACAADGTATEVLVAASEHGVEALLRRAVTLRPDTFRALASLLEGRFARSVAASMRQRTDLADTVAALDGLGVAHVVVKGPVLAGHAYGDLALRYAGDLDLLVAPADVDRVVASLGDETALGDLASARADGHSETSLTLRHGTSLDLHWHLLNADSLQRTFSLPTGEVLARRRTVEVAGRPVPTPDRADTLVHLALHAVVSGGHRLTWYVDLDRCIRTDGVPPDLVERARAAGAGVALALLLRRCAAQLGTPLPAGLLHDLADGSAWYRLGRPLARVPVSASPRRVSRGQTFYRATRASTGAGLVAAARLLPTALRTRAHRG